MCGCGVVHQFQRKPQNEWTRLEEWKSFQSIVQKNNCPVERVHWLGVRSWFGSANCQHLKMTPFQKFKVLLLKGLNGGQLALEHINLLLESEVCTICLQEWSGLS